MKYACMIHFPTILYRNEASSSFESFVKGGDMKGNLSRRAFLGFGGIAAASAGVALAGCSPATKTAQTGSSAATSASDANVEWDKEVDVVVVGYGGAGSAAAIEAKRAGASVAVSYTHLRTLAPRGSRSAPPHTFLGKWPNGMGRGRRPSAIRLRAQGTSPIHRSAPGPW